MGEEGEGGGRTSTVCWPFSIRAIGNRAIFAVIAVRRSRTRLFKQPLRKHARVHAYAYTGIATIDRPMKKRSRKLPREYSSCVRTEIFSRSFTDKEQRML